MLEKTHLCTRTLIWLHVALLCLSATHLAPAQATSAKSVDGLPTWVSEVGSRREPSGLRIFSANRYGAVNDELKNSTTAIQTTIDACSKAGGGIVTLKPEKYVTGALFLKSDVHLRLDRGVTLLGSCTVRECASIRHILLVSVNSPHNFPTIFLSINFFDEYSSDQTVQSSSCKAGTREKS